MQVIPLLIVTRIEDSLPYWTARLGFEVLMTVPLADAPDPANPPQGFVMLQREGQLVELQSRASLQGDLPALAPTAGIATVYLSVPSIAPFAAALADYPDVLETRETWYGRRELVTREPSGHFVIFGAPIAETPTP